MKVDDATLQSIINTYGKGLQIKKSPENSKEPKKQAIIKKKEKKLHLTPKDMSVINYSKDGTVNIDEEKKQSLIDFFQ